MAYRYSRGWRLFTIGLLRPPLFLLLRRNWRGQEKIPRTGGVILACNHISEVDPFAIAHYVYKADRYPVFLAKEAVFRIPVLGRIVGWVGEIPVLRGSSDASRAFDGAREALDAGQCVIFYPEGTCTRDPELWPMVAKTGVARLALETGAPVIPVANWGAQELLRYGSSKVNLFPRKVMNIAAGDPVDLTAHSGPEPDADTLRAATEAIMRSISALLGELRGQTPPKEIYDPQKTAVEERKQS
ncbi:lysophospholipid acyltransferase family protein [Actinocorallia longicatena]|uniref:Lysophospholipid acyltransferase family protein n=1 Tax=Actinocorallia longicatena TaxID=111803 RepID=A0ABP6PZI0_9ACTN